MSSDAFEKLLRGEISSKEYVATLGEEAHREAVERRYKRTIEYNRAINPNPSQEVAVTSEHKTVGVDPKVPVQAITTVLVFLLSYFGIDLDPTVAGAISVLIGVVAGAVAPAAKTVLKSS